MKNKIFILISITMFFTSLLQAQCYPDRHNTTWFDGWISCETSPSPNSIRGESHWLLYNLNHAYDLGQMHIWNTNAPDYLHYGIEDVVIDVSHDGINWTEAGQFTFQQAQGTSTYEGFEGPNLEGFNARYILITALTNYGGICFGLSEVKVDVLGLSSIAEPATKYDCLSVNVYPNPVISDVNVYINSTCSTKEIQYFIRDLTGRTLMNGVTQPGSKTILNLNVQGLASGSYILNVEQDRKIIRHNLIKIN